MADPALLAALEEKTHPSIRDTAQLLKILSNNGSNAALELYRKVINELLADVSLDFRGVTIDAINDRTEVVVHIENPDYCHSHSQFPIRMVSHDSKTNQIILSMNDERLPIEQQNVFKQLTADEISARVKYQLDNRDRDTMCSASKEHVADDNADNADNAADEEPAEIPEIKEPTKPAKIVRVNQVLMDNMEFFRFMMEQDKEYLDEHIPMDVQRTIVHEEMHNSNNFGELGRRTIRRYYEWMKENKADVLQQLCDEYMAKQADSA